MHIIMGREIAEELRKKYTVLELETFDGITAFCVVQPEDIVLTDMPDLERLQRLHQAFIDSFNAKNYAMALEAVQHLRGRFSGSVDSFYDVLTERIKDLAID